MASSKQDTQQDAADSVPANALETFFSMLHTNNFSGDGALLAALQQMAVQEVFHGTATDANPDADAEQLQSPHR